MEKAYDVKELAERLKGVGMPILEETTKEVIEVFFKWLEDSADISPNLYDDMAKLILKPVKQKILERISYSGSVRQADKIHKD